MDNPYIILGIMAACFVVLAILIFVIRKYSRSSLPSPLTHNNVLPQTSQLPVKNNYNTQTPSPIAQTTPPLIQTPSPIAQTTPNNMSPLTQTPLPTAQTTLPLTQTPSPTAQSTPNNMSPLTQTPSPTAQTTPNNMSPLTQNTTTQTTSPLTQIPAQNTTTQTTPNNMSPLTKNTTAQTTAPLTQIPAQNTHNNIQSSAQNIMSPLTQNTTAQTTHNNISSSAQNTPEASDNRFIIISTYENIKSNILSGNKILTNISNFLRYKMDDNNELLRFKLFYDSSNSIFNEILNATDINTADKLMYIFNQDYNMDIRDMIRDGMDKYNNENNICNFRLNDIEYKSVVTSGNGCSCLLHSIFQANSAVYRYLLSNKQNEKIIEYIRILVFYPFVRDHRDKISSLINGENIDSDEYKRYKEELLRDIINNNQLLSDLYECICYMLDVNLVRPEESQYDLPYIFKKNISTRLSREKIIFRDENIHSTEEPIDKFLENIYTILKNRNKPYTLNEDIVTYINRGLRESNGGTYLDFINFKLDEYLKINRDLTWSRFTSIDEYNRMVGSNIHDYISGKSLEYANEYVSKKFTQPPIPISGLDVFIDTYCNNPTIYQKYDYDDSFIKYRKIIVGLMYNPKNYENTYDYNTLLGNISLSHPLEEYKKLNIDNSNIMADSQRIIPDIYVNISASSDTVDENALPEYMRADIANIREMREYIDKLGDNTNELKTLYDSILAYKFYNCRVFGASLTLISNNPNAICIYISSQSLGGGHYNTVKGYIDLTKYIGSLNNVALVETGEIIKNYLIRRI
jgi:hypothetical protein